MNEVDITLPKTLYRVVWLEGFGWPECTRRELRQRNYGSARVAAEQVASIRLWPDHHVLVGVWLTNTAWSQFDADMLPQPGEKAGPIGVVL